MTLLVICFITILTLTVCCCIIYIESKGTFGVYAIKKTQGNKKQNVELFPMKILNFCPSYKAQTFQIVISLQIRPILFKKFYLFLSTVSSGVFPSILLFVALPSFSSNELSILETQ